jgi:hypothetical protein
MAHLDVEHADAEPDAFASSAPAGELQRTKYMLVITVIASISIIVVAALFMSLF